MAQVQITFTLTAEEASVLEQMKNGDDKSLHTAAKRILKSVIQHGVGFSNTPVPTLAEDIVQGYAPFAKAKEMETLPYIEERLREALKRASIQ